MVVSDEYDGDMTTQQRYETASKRYRELFAAEVGRFGIIATPHHASMYGGYDCNRCHGMTDFPGLCRACKAGPVAMRYLDGQMHRRPRAHSL